jgi:soluble lytic murein transglycosylase
MTFDDQPIAKRPPEHFRDPFRLLKAILIGVSLGFVAVMLRPVFFPTAKAPVETAARVPSAAAPAQPAIVAPPRQAGGEPATPPPSAKPKAGTPAPAPAKSEPPVPIAAAPSPVPSAPAAVASETKPAAVPTPPPAAGSETARAPASEPASDTAANNTASAPPAEAVPQQTPLTPAAEEAKSPEPPPIVPALEVTYPKPFTAAEMTEALKPLLEYKLGDDDLTALKAILQNAARGLDVHRAAIQKLSDASARKYAEWRVLRASQASLPDQLAFRAQNPLFPSPLLDVTSERAMFFADAPPADVIKFFAIRRPATGPGKAVLGDAYMKTGQTDRGLRMIRQAWSRHELDPQVETRFMARFGSLVTEADRVQRVAFLAARGLKKEAAARNAALESVAAAGARAAARVMAQRAAQKQALRAKARRPIRLNRRGRYRADGQPKPPSRFALANAMPVMQAAAWRWPQRKFVPDAVPEKPGAAVPQKPNAQAADPKAAARSAPQTAQAKAAQQAIKLAKEVEADSATLFTRLSNLKRQKADKKLWSLLRSVDPVKADLADPERWWDFRRTEMRRALNLGKPRTAYGVVKAHGPLDEETTAEAQFLSGWTALRHLKRPQAARTHFEQARLALGSPRDQARSAYWLGQSRFALKQDAEGRAALGDAAKRWFAFYGALAQNALGTAPPCEFRAPPKPDAAQAAAFAKIDAVRVAMIVKQLDQPQLLVSYFLDLARQIDDPAHMTLLLELAERIGPPHVAIRAAKIAIQRGFAVEAYALPVLLPKFEVQGENGKIEPAVLNALTRQESEFDASSKSPVGAKGLMQLMPGTARLVAANLKTKYEPARLTSDPSYNVTLGSTYLASLLTQFDGSYVLSLAAYNAGPGRVSQWIKEFGDPRKRDVDPIDWIERIPFTETREYVQRILESTQLYRCRIEQGKTTVQIVRDLNRGRPVKAFDVFGAAGPMPEGAMP